MEREPSVQLIRWTPNPIGTIKAVWDISKTGRPLPEILEACGCNVETTDEESRKLFKKVVEMGIPVSEFLNFVFTFEDVPVWWREQLVRERVNCLTGDTRIRLLNGQSVPIKELSKFPDKQFGIYVYDSKKKAVSVGWLTHPRRSGVKVVYRVTLDNNRFVDATAEHPFMLRDGFYRELKDLQVGDSLMPLYTEINETGYERLDLNNGSSKYTHRLVAEVNYPEAFTQGYVPVVHHKDFYKLNNDPSNLEPMHWVTHSKLHQKLIGELWKQDWFKELNKLRLKRLWEQDWFREKMTAVGLKNVKRMNELYTTERRSIVTKLLWKQPEYRDAVSLGIQLSYVRDPSLKLLMKRQMEEMWKKPHYRKVFLAGGKLGMEIWKQDPRFFSVCSANGTKVMTKLWQNPEFVKRAKERARQHLIKLWNDPTYANEIAQNLVDLWKHESFREKMVRLVSERNRINWTKPAYRAKMIIVARRQGKINMAKLRQDPIFLAKQKVGRMAALERSILSPKSRKKCLESRMLPEKASKRKTAAQYASLVRWAKVREQPIPVYNPSIKNHKIIKIELLGEREVFDVTVEGYENFALAAGVFVHNSYWVQSHRILDLSKFGEDELYYIPKIIRENAEQLSIFKKTMSMIGNVYKDFVLDGVPMEDARSVIPMCATHRLSMQINLRNLIGLIKKRSCFILQISLWHPIINQMIHELETKVDPVFKMLRNPICFRGGKFIGCRYSHDNERRLKGQDKLPPCCIWMKAEQKSLKELPDKEAYEKGKREMIDFFGDWILK